MDAIPTTTSKGRVSVLARLKRFDRTQRHAVLATALNDRPYASLVAFAIAPDHRGLLFATPRGTAKYRNISEGIARRSYESEVKSCMIWRAAHLG